MSDQEIIEVLFKIIKEGQITEIRNSNLNLYQLAEKYKVTPSTIHYIRAKKTWKHVS